MSLRVATTHTIKYSDELLSGRLNCDSFFARLHKYFEKIGVCGGIYTMENISGEVAGHEVHRRTLEALMEQPDEFFEGEDKKTIASILEKADKDNDYVYLYCF